MDKTYRPQDIEQHWYQIWEESGLFKPDANQHNGEGYSIVIPPPNVTGSLHMGHAFQHTLQDALIRHARMSGKKTLWQVGTDHAGIATQMLVERKVAREEGKQRHDFTREEFMQKIWQWKQESGGTITQQMRRLGNSVDWQRERFTMDDGFYAAVQEAFIRLYNDGLIYRGKRLVNWDSKLHTAISDLEVENKEEQGKMYHVRYPFVDKSIRFGGGYMHIATTRPETILADGCLAVHPDDERYKEVIGKMVHVPMTERTIPIVTDPYPDPEFGTGCVKITPAHDFNDYQVGQRQNIEIINLFTDDASMNENAPKRYQGMDRFVARDAIVADLEQAGLLEKIEDHTLVRPYGDRSGTVIEPYLTDQWYVDAKKLAAPAIQAVTDGDIQFVPKNYENMYFSWMRDIQDWCISRQLWWGHRIPAYYDTNGNIYVGASEQAVREQHNLGEEITLSQDEDVLDTWFSSALWTFATLGWPNEADKEVAQRLKDFHPTDVLVTGFDIIFFWVARMIMMSLHLVKDEQGKPQVPFKTVYVTGLIRDEQGDKMSKSKGNVLDPLDMIDGIDLETLLAKRTGNMMQDKLATKIAKRTKKEFPQGINAHGTDALRFTLSALATTGRDINWDMHRLEGYRNFCNKLWNASRYVMLTIAPEEEVEQASAQNRHIEITAEMLSACAVTGEEYTLSLADKWIISSLQRLEEQVDNHFKQYRFDLIAQNLYEFTWNEYCDWYLELSKPVLWNTEDEAAKRGTRRTLVRVLETILRLIHPIMPFISEAIWQQVKTLAGKQGDSISLAPYPKADPSKLDPNAEDDIEWLKKAITSVRNIRGELNISPAIELELLLHKGNSKDRERSIKLQPLLSKLAKLKEINWLEENQIAPMAATQLIDELELLVPIAKYINKEQEIARLNKEIGKLEQEAKRISGKLANAKFVDNAPADVVAKERDKLKQYQFEIESLSTKAQAISNL